MKVDEATFFVLQAYARVFDSPDGQLVLQDMERAYSMGQNDDLLTAMAEIPHPYRAYFAEGGRDVVRRIRAAMTTAGEAEIDDG